MIINFLDKETEKIYNQIFSKKLPTDIQNIALRKLLMIASANSIGDLYSPPSNHLEKMAGDSRGRQRYTAIVNLLRGNG